MFSVLVTLSKLRGSSGWWIQDFRLKEVRGEKNCKKNHIYYFKISQFILITIFQREGGSVVLITILR